MIILNKETKSKGLMLKMHLITEQRDFVVKTYYKTSSSQEVKEAFRKKFLEKDPQINRRAWKNKKITKEKGHS